MAGAEDIVEVLRPVRTVYDKWRKFEEFPRFMHGVKAVTQIDDTHVRWHGEIWGLDTPWEVEITEQLPDLRIAWRSTSGPVLSGEVRLEPLGPKYTRVYLRMSYEADDSLDRFADTVGVLKAQVHKSVEDFKRFIESAEPGNGASR
jgi:uncharacterized membrane protein